LTGNRFFVTQTASTLMQAVFQKKYILKIIGLIFKANGICIILVDINLLYAGYKPCG
jgi:hypothetical protein